MTSTTAPAAPPRAATGYAVSVRRARSFLQFLLLAMVVLGIVTTIISFLAAQDTLGRYRTIVADSAVSADAAQAARASVLAHHRAAADYLVRLDTGAAAEARARADQSWPAYQESLRRLWQNRSDVQFGEFAVFNAADRATLQYRGSIDAMYAFLAAGDRAAAETAFLQSHDILVQRLIPALNGLEGLKLESMEAAYATTSDAISLWQQALLYIGGFAVGLLVLSVLLSRFWLRYRWTWELALASLLGLLLFGWFNLTLLRATDEVEVLVRRAYDTAAGVQSVEALLTQAAALESMAVFLPEQAPLFLRDADEYLFLAEQQLCGERTCTDEPFVSGDAIRFEAREAALEGQQTYGLPRMPLVAAAYINRFPGEAAALEALRVAVQAYRGHHEQLATTVTTAAGVPAGWEQEREQAYQAALRESGRVREIARGRFDWIYETVTLSMGVNRWLAFAFTALAVLGFWGLRRRREALFP
jgi:hypothetical protein